MNNNPFGFNPPPYPGLPPKVVRPPLASSFNLFNPPQVNPPAVDPKPFRPMLAGFLLNPAPAPTGFGALLASIPFKPTRPRIFVSYQHTSDQYYYNEFSRIFHDVYESVFDNSMERCIDSDNSEYVMQRIRDEFLTGCSCTIVLVGPTTYQRKFIDWEIKATLDKQHGLIGIQLPNVIPDYNNMVLVPPRLNANINSGYALWQGFTWHGLIANPALLNELVQIAANRDKSLIFNRKDIKKQNG